MREPASIKDLLATSHRKTFPSSGRHPLSQERPFYILIVDQMKGPNGLRFYLQFALQLNRRFRGRGAHFWATI